MNAAFWLEVGKLILVPLLLAFYSGYCKLRDDKNAAANIIRKEEGEASYKIRQAEIEAEGGEIDKAIDLYKEIISGLRSDLKDAKAERDNYRDQLNARLGVK